MAEVLQDYLVSVRYAVDSASQQNFLNQLKSVATSVTGVAGEIAALGVAVMGMAKSFADAGTQLYFSSQRLGSSVANISALTSAMRDMGLSAAEAHASIEGFGAWVRTMGPGATGFLRTIGVTATNTTDQMVQLGQALKNIASKTNWATMLQYADAMHLSEQAVRALMNVADSLKERKAIQAAVWGPNPERAAQEFADQAQAVTKQFNLMGFFFDQLRDKFASGLFQRVLPYLKDFNQQLISSMPRVDYLMTQVLRLVPPLLDFLAKAVTVLSAFTQMVGSAIDVLGKLPPAFKFALEAMIGIAAGLRLMSSPLGLVFMGLTALLALLDDFRAYQQGAEHLLPWESISKFRAVLEPLVALIGVPLVLRFLGFAGAIRGIVRSFGLLTGIRMGATIGEIGALEKGITSLTRLAGPINILVTALLALADAFSKNRSGQQMIEQAAEARGYKLKRDHPWSEFYYEKEGKRFSQEEVRHELGLDPRTGLTKQQIEAGKMPEPSGYTARTAEEIQRDERAAAEARHPEIVGRRARREWGGGKPGHEPAPGPPSPPATTTQPPEAPPAGGGGGKAWFKPWTWGRPRAEAAGGSQFAGPGAPTTGEAQARVGTTGTYGDYLTQKFAADQAAGAAAGDITRQQEQYLPETDGGGPSGPVGGIGGVSRGGPGEEGPTTMGAMSADTKKKMLDVATRLSTDLGISKEAAAGIVGNLMQESGLRAGAEEKPGTGRGGLGWGQWTGPRRQDFERFLKEHPGMSADEANYAYLLQDIRKPQYAEMRKALRQQGISTGQATRTFEGTYEVAGTPMMARREAYAAQTAQLLQGQPLMSGQTAIAANQNIPQPAGETRGGPTINTTINVNGAGDPNAVGNAVAGHQKRVNESHIRASGAGKLA